VFSSINGMLLPFRAKISYMSGEYSDEWAELRRLRRRVLTVVFAGAAIFVLVPLVSTFALPATAKAIGLALFAAWVLGAVQVFLGVWRVRLLVMPEMRQAFPLHRTLVRQMEQSVRSALRSLWLAKM